MEVNSATLSYLEGSPQKVRLVADLVRGKKVEEALNILRSPTRRRRSTSRSCLQSAVANAENREDHVDVDELFVSEIFVDDGRGEADPAGADGPRLPGPEAEEPHHDHARTAEG